MAKMDGQIDHYLSADRPLAFDPDRAAMKADIIAGDDQAQPAAFMFGSEERRKELFYRLLVHALTRIADGDRNVLMCRAVSRLVEKEGDEYFASGSNCLSSVIQETSQGMLQQDQICPRHDRLVESDKVVSDALSLEILQGNSLDKCGQLDADEAWPHRFSQQIEVFNKAVDPLNAAIDRPQLFRIKAILDLILQHGNGSGNARQWIAYLVGNGPRHLR